MDFVSHVWRFTDEEAYIYLLVKEPEVSRMAYDIYNERRSPHIRNMGAWLLKAMRIRELEELPALEHRLALCTRPYYFKMYASLPRYTPCVVHMQKCLHPKG